jgi:hypothetical protein
MEQRLRLLEVECVEPFSDAAYGRWLPRQIDIDQASDEESQDIVITANLTPRKCRGFKIFQSILKELGKDIQIRFACCTWFWNSGRRAQALRERPPRCVVLYMSSSRPRNAVTHWHRWFAWRPVFILSRRGKRLVWLRYVERRWTEGKTSGLGPRWIYRRIRAEETEGI